MQLTNDSAISSITWRQPPSEATEPDIEGTLTLGFSNSGSRSWITVQANGFSFDSADEILNLAVIAEDLRQKHEKAAVFG